MATSTTNTDSKTNNNGTPAPSSISNLPNQRILLRWKEGIEIYELPSWYSTSKCLSNNSFATECDKGKLWTLIESKNCKFHSISQDGTKVVVLVAGKGVFICDIAEDGEKRPLQGNTENVALAYFSPLHTFLVTWERFNSNVHNPTNPNVKLWKSSTGEYLLGWSLKVTPNRLASQPRQQQTSVGQYSILQWTSDEALMMFGGNSQIIVYDGKLKGGDEKLPFDVVLKIPCPNLGLFSISPKGPNDVAVNNNNNSSLLAGYVIATFVPEVKGKPGRVSLKCITKNIGANEWSCREVVGKSFYQTEECNVHWSPIGDAMLCVTQMTVDSTGQSYYGSSNVYLFTGSKAIQVSLPNHRDDEVGIVHDIAWNPKKSQNPPTFALVSGKMPAMTSLHHGYTAAPIFLFGKNHRNTIVWAPHGRFVCFGGYGNLAGNFDFWDKNKGKRIPRITGDTTQAIRGTSVPIGYTFSADSRLYLISTTSPRLNVENGIQLFRYNGDGPISLPLIDKDRYSPNKLYYAEFVPALNGNVYPDRPQSPLPKRGSDEDISNTTGTVSAASEAVPKKTGRYVPPGLRNKSSGSFNNSLAERMRREREGEMGGPTKVTGNGNSRKGNIPGMAPVNRNNQRSIPGLAPVKNNQNKTKSSADKWKKEKQPPQASPKETKKITTKIPAVEVSISEPVVETKSEPPPSEPVPVDPEKRAKKIRKLLKQIEEIKTSGKDLNDDQKKKIASYDSLCLELKELGL